VLGTAATQGVYTELYEKLHSTFSTSLISFEQDKFSLLRKSCFKVRSRLPPFRPRLLDSRLIYNLDGGGAGDGHADQERGALRGALRPRSPQPP
jgi:hypothetical protein